MVFLLGIFNTGISPVSAEKSGEDWVKHWCDRAYCHIIDVRDEMDMPTLKNINPFFSKDKNTIFYLDYRGDSPIINTLDDADYESFAVIGGNLAKDKNNLYLSGYKVTDLDKDSAQWIGSNADLSRLYLKDKNGIYLMEAEAWFKFLTHLITNDVENFQFFNSEFSDFLGEYGWYSRDTKNVYYRDKKIKNADPETFQFLPNEYFFAKDKNLVFHDEHIIEGADPETFEIVPYATYMERNRYGKDKNNVFYINWEYTAMLKNADPKTFEHVIYDGDSNSQYGKDKNHVFYHEKQVKDADVKSFAIKELALDNGYRYAPQDKNNVFDEDQIMIFSDSFRSDHSYPAITFLKEKGIVKGYKDGSFGYWNPINRAEFVKMALLTKYSTQEISRAKTQKFPDIEEGKWYAPYVNFAKEKGIVKGLKDGKFHPEKSITLAEASKVLVNLLLEKTEDSKTEEWWTPFVEKLEPYIQIQLSHDKPSDQLIRGDMAKILYGLKEFIR